MATTTRRPRPELQFEAAMKVSRSVLETDVWGVASTVARAGMELVSAQQSSLGLTDPDSGNVFTAAHLELPPPSARFARGQGVAGWVAATRRPALIHDVRKDPRYLRLRYPTVRSFVSVPLLAGGELVGVLSCGAWETHAFGELDLAALTAFAEHAGIMLRLAQDLHARREQAEESKGFLLDVVHELKAPLQSISGLLELTLQGEPQALTERQRDFLAAARLECDRLSQNIAAILEMGVAQRRPAMATQIVGVDELVQAVLGRLRPVAQTRRIELCTYLPEAPPKLDVDTAGIQQVLTNLVSNALRMSPAGGVVEVHAETHGREALIYVTDVGPGVPYEQRPQIFERFAQTEEAGRAPGDIGLGLALSRDIVERHGGRIWVESRDGGGASFRFTLPLQR